MPIIYLVSQYRWLFLLSLIQELIFWIYKSEIFDWNPEAGLLYKKIINEECEKIKNNKNGESIIQYKWADRKKVYKEAPCAWKIYRFILEFTGIFIGWVIMSLVVEKFISNGFRSSSSLANFWNLLLALIFGLIGIFGRIPVIIESVQEWFKR